MFPFTKKKKSKACQEFEQYTLDLLALKEKAKDPNATPAERETAKRKLSQLDKHHTQKIADSVNGQAKAEDASEK